MDMVSFRSIVAMLLVLSMFVTVITTLLRQGNLDLTGRYANMRRVYKRSIIVGVILAAILRANIFDILQNPESPALFLGWLSLPWGEYAGITEKVIGIIEEFAGILVTGVVLAFVSRFWNELMDIMFEFKRWMRGKANASKPEESVARSSSSGGMSRGGSPRGGDRGRSDSRRGGRDSRPRSSSGGDRGRSSSGDDSSRRPSGGDRGRSSGGDDSSRRPSGGDRGRSSGGGDRGRSSGDRGRSSGDSPRRPIADAPRSSSPDGGEDR
jgi:hypothetical protein